MDDSGRRSNTPRPNPYADIQVELTALCFDRLTPVVISSGATFMAVCAVIAYHYQSRWLWHLTAMAPAPWALRLSVAVLFPKKKVAEMNSETAWRWETAYGLATILYVTGGAVATMSTIHRKDSIALGLCTLGTFAYSNGISARLSLRPWIAKLSGLILMSGLAIAILGSDQPITRYSVVLLAMYAYFYCEAIQVKYDVLVEQLRLKHKLHDLADHDTLTGLANRRQFEGRLVSICLQPESFAVLFMDLDGFKDVNDRHGHPIGDALLQQVARRLQSAVPGSDLLARLGGDEFAILHTPGATADTAQDLARHIIKAVSMPYTIEGHQVCVSTSIGIQLSTPGVNDPHNLLSAADKALYVVKQSGKGSFRLAETDSGVKLIFPETAAESLLQGTPACIAPSLDTGHSVRGKPIRTAEMTA